MQQHNPQPPPQAVEVGHHTRGVAVVTVRGEHDLSTVALLTRSLDVAAEHSHVVVDLSECSFIDSSVIAALVKAARRVQARGERLIAVIPGEQKAVARIAELTRLAEFFPIEGSREAALAGLEVSRADARAVNALEVHGRGTVSSFGRSR